MRDEFARKVIEPFISAYAEGITPNPCILCNRHIKFPYLLKIANEKGADCIATGHYARVQRNRGLPAESIVTSDNPDTLPPAPGSPLLLRGIDPKKDQSYVLYALKPDELERLVLPLGGLMKDEVRAIGKKLNLSAVNRPESQEICFIEDGKYFKMLEGLTGSKEGPIIDMESGVTLGKHKGIYRYTMGQRKRLGISAGTALYVVKIDRRENIVYVGHKEAAMMREFMVEDINWLNPPIPSFGEGGFYEFRTTVKIRSTMKDEPALLLVSGSDRARIVYDAPQWAPAPGQSAVFYDGDRVIGGGVISLRGVTPT